MFKWISQIKTQNNNKYVPLSERGYGEAEGIFSIKKEKNPQSLRDSPFQ